MKNTLLFITRKSLLIPIAIIAFTFFARAQDTAIEWQKCFGGSDYDMPEKAIATADGGLVVIGTTLSNDGDVSGNEGGYDAWIIKLDAQGNLQWQKTIGGNYDDFAYGISQMSGGDYLVAGKTNSTSGTLAATNGMYDGWLARLSTDGKILWTKTMGTHGDDCFNAVFECENGNIVVAGSISRGTAGEQGYTDYLLMKINAAGKILWAKPYGGSNEEVLSAAVRTPAGDFLLCGYSSSHDGMLAGTHGNNNVWIIKTDANGNMYWRKIVGNYIKGNAVRCAVTNESDFLISGFQSLNARHQKTHFNVAQFSNGGKEEWSYSFPENNYATYKGLRCTKQNDGGYFLGGIIKAEDSNGNETMPEIFGIKLNSNGVPQWNQMLSSNQKDAAAILFQSLDECFVFTGQKIAPATNNAKRIGFADFCIMKIAQGELAFTKE